MRSANYYHKQFESANYIVVNGVKMSEKEYKAMHSKPRKKAEKKFTSITILPIQMTDMMKSVRVLKSLVAYHRNGYRQWGKIATTIMGLREIKKPFDDVVIYTKQSIRLVEKIKKIAKSNDKDVFQYIKKLQWKLEDLQKELDQLVQGITTSQVMRQFKDHECINGEGRRLGLRILCQRSRKAVSDLDDICNKLNEIEQNGIDVFEYKENGKK